MFFVIWAGFFLFSSGELVDEVFEFDDDGLDGEFLDGFEMNGEFGFIGGEGLCDFDFIGHW